MRSKRIIHGCGNSLDRVRAHVVTPRRIAQGSVPGIHRPSLRLSIFWTPPPHGPEQQIEVTLKPRVMDCKVASLSCSR